MSREPEYKFVSTDVEAIVAQLVTEYENRIGRALRPADPEKLFISWVADIIYQERVLQNYIGNQNIPSRAEGENLDALGEWIYGVQRLAAQPSKCTERFYISAAQSTTVVIPQGTRVTTSSGSPVWYTTAEATIPIGETYVDVMVQCETTGESGNDYEAGQINKLIDVDNILYYSSCENTDRTSGGADEATDEQFFERMKDGLSAFSTAGPSGAYSYWAKQVAANIVDVKAIQPRQRIAKTIPLYTDGDSVKHGFLAGEHLMTDTLVVRSASGATPATKTTDYTISGETLLDITIKSTGSLASLDSIYVEIDAEKAGYVYLYALMEDGTLAGQSVKDAILSAVNKENVRPLTDYVSVEDAELVDYTVNLTFYTDRNSTKPVTEIEADVKAAVNEYTAWQSGKIGRDINPSYLNWLLKDTGVKRVVITSPVFTPLRSGDDHTVPQVAHLSSSPTITNGGKEDD